MRAGLVQYAWDWPCSSARAPVTGVDDTGLLNMDAWRTRFEETNGLKEFLQEGPKSNSEIDCIRLTTRTGLPLGSEDFIRWLEAITGS